MRVIFMGTPDFAVGTLEAIITAGHEVVGVVTQPDKRQGRSSELRMSPVKECAIKHNIDVYQPVKVRDPEFVEILRGMEPEVIVVVAFGQIIPKSVLEMPKYGCVNVHASLLPKYRGAAPIQWAVINGDEVTGVTTMLMDEGIDTGDILMVREYKVEPKETGGSLFDKLENIGAELLVETLDGLKAGSITPIPQGENFTHVGKLEKTTGVIDFNKSAVEIERLIRGLNPWPSAYTSFNGKTLKIWDADIDDCDCSMYAPGTIYKVDKKNIYVSTAKGGLILNEIQLEGKKRMDTEAFLRGCQVETGVVL